MVINLCTVSEGDIIKFIARGKMADQESMPSKLTHVYKANSTNDFDLGHDTDKLVVSEIEAENGKKVLLDEQDSLSHEGHDAEPAEVRKRCLV